MRPLRILLAMIEPPLPFGNAAARWYYVLLKGLVERGHHVTAFAACSRAEDIEAAQALFPRSRYDLRCYPCPRRGGWRAKLETFRRPYSYMFSPELRADLLHEARAPFDLLHLEQLWSGWLGLELSARALLNLHFLYSIDLAEVPPTTARGRIDRWLMLKGERRLLRAYRNLVALTPRLSDAARRANPAAVVHTCPLGMDVSLYPFIAEERRPTRPVVSVIGSMDWYPSHSAAVRFLTRLWPEIRRRIPEARAEIVGRQARSALRDHLATPGVTVEENVPDMRPYFERSSLLLYAPCRGSGMKVKVLEAMAFGVPVVTTSEGIEGIPAEDGIHVGLAEKDDQLIQRTVRLLHDRPAQMGQRAAARGLLERHCGPRATLDRMEAIYEDIFARRGAETSRE